MHKLRSRDKPSLNLTEILLSEVLLQQLVGGQEKEQSCETTNLHLMNIYTQTSFVFVKQMMKLCCIHKEMQLCVVVCTDFMVFMQVSSRREHTGFVFWNDMDF